MPGKLEYLSQVCLKDRDLVHSLLERSSVGNGDVVVEIGPGKGIITDELLVKAGRVIAIEKDAYLYAELVQKYQGNSNIELHHYDFQNFDLPHFPFKIFSNIPFSIESQTVRRLIDDPHNPPLDSYLVMRREVTDRLAGIPREGQFSVLHKPWFELEAFYYFKRGDFQPKPKVESAMFRFKKKDTPLINSDDKRLYNLFIAQGFGGGGRLKQNLANAFTMNQLASLARNYGFRIDNMPTDLAFEQWLALFYFWIERVPESQKQRFITKARK